MKLWDKGYQVLKQIEKFTVGKDPELDLKLVPYDCKGSKAHAEMLGAMGILTKEEVVKLKKQLDEIIRLSEEKRFVIKEEDEDCHTAIEKRLTEALGELGKKIHTTRSRNDQVLTAMRLFEKDQLTRIGKLLEDFIKSVDTKIAEYGPLLFPGYTHTRQAMPTHVEMWLDCYRSGARDNIRFVRFIKDWIDQSPLGTAAGYGVPVFHIDRNLTAESMGFKEVLENPVYAQLSRGKFETTIVHVLAQILFDLNRLASDLIFFSMEEFGFVILPDEICTGSSIMPQKKNPDVLELVRSSYHVIIGEETKIRTMASNLILGYHRDIQLSKEPVMNAFQIAEDCIGLTTLVINNIRFDKERGEKMVLPSIYATEEAYRLVGKGVPFRDAYREIAKRLKSS